MVQSRREERNRVLQHSPGMQLHWPAMMCPPAPAFSLLSIISVSAGASSTATSLPRIVASMNPGGGRNDRWLPGAASVATPLPGACSAARRRSSRSLAMSAAVLFGPPPPLGRMMPPPPPLPQAGAAIAIRG